MAKSILHSDIFDTLSWHETVLHKPKDVVLAFEEKYELKKLYHLLSYAIQEYKATSQVPYFVSYQLSNVKQCFISLIKVGYYLANKHDSKFKEKAQKIYKFSTCELNERWPIILNFEVLIADPLFTIWHQFQNHSLSDVIVEITIVMNYFNYAHLQIHAIEESMPILLSLIQLIQALDKVYNNSVKAFYVKNQIN